MTRLSKEKRNQLIGVAAGTLAVCAALWYFVISSQNGSLARYQDTIQELRGKIDKAQRLVKRRASIVADLTSLTNQIAQAEAEMIPVEQLSGNKWLWDKLNHFTKDRYDVTLISLSVDAAPGNQFLLLPKFSYSAAVYSVEVRAFFHEFGRFLADFENSFPYMWIQNLQTWPLLTPSAATTGQGAEVPDDLLVGDSRERLRISMKIVVLFKPAGAS